MKAAHVGRIFVLRMLNGDFNNSVADSHTPTLTIDLQIYFIILSHQIFSGDDPF